MKILFNGRKKTVAGPTLTALTLSGHGCHFTSQNNHQLKKSKAGKNLAGSHTKTTMNLSNVLRNEY